jgi:hypothetical protein
LPSEAVESLGLGALDSLAAAEHAIAQRGRTLVLTSAQHRSVHPVGTAASTESP